MDPFREVDVVPKNGWRVAAFCEDTGAPVALHCQHDGTAANNRRISQEMKDREQAQSSGQ